MNEIDENIHDSLSNEWAIWVSNISDWKSFWTLTFCEADRTHDVTETEADFKWRTLIQVLNTDLWGNHYTRSVGHSYFGYALAYERTSKGLLHMHALVDDRTNWELANSVWRRLAGIIKIVPVSDKSKVAKYLCKYVTKGGAVNVYMPKKRKQPAFRPMWYVGGVEGLIRDSSDNTISG